MTKTLIREGYHGKALELSNWKEVIYNRITIKGTSAELLRRGILSMSPGFIYFDNTEVLKEAVSDMTKWIEEGKIDVTESETVVDTVFEDIPKTWGRLFVGENRGKLITKLVPNQGQPNL